MASHALHIYTSKLKISYFLFWIGQCLKLRFDQHNKGLVQSTKPHLPWKLVWYGGFETEKEARDFERYLKSGSGKAFAYKRLVSGALARDFSRGRNGIPKPEA